MRTKKKRGVIAIDRDIPVPPPRRKYPIYDLKVGESFAVPADKAPSFGGIIHYCRSKFPKRRFRYSAQADGTYRLWRIA